jgi:hypothetical protein
MKEVLGVPDELAIAGLIALGRPVKQPRRLTRSPVESSRPSTQFSGPAFSLSS